MNDKFIIKNKLKDFEVDIETTQNASKMVQLESDLDKLISKADLTDYIIAVASGLLCSVLDFIFTRNLSLAEAQNWGTEQVNDLVISFAKHKGCKTNDLTSCISFLEKKYEYASDALTNEFGGGLQHHLRDYTHHCSPLGLLFSIISQFTGKVYGTDKNGNFVSYQLPDELIGNSFTEKLSLGIIQWFLHVSSDIAGSSNSTRAGKAGSGLPGPILSFIKYLSSTPLFGKENSEVRKKLSLIITKLFNGTLIKEDGVPIKFDFRMEIGFLGKIITKEIISPLINDIVIRTTYFLRRLSWEIKDAQTLENINWNKVLPYKNETILRMLTVSSGVMVSVDIATFYLMKKKSDNNTNVVGMILTQINIPGLISFAFNIGTEIKNAYKRHRLVKQILKENENRNAVIGSETLAYLNKRWIILNTANKILPLISKTFLMLALMHK